MSGTASKPHKARRSPEGARKHALRCAARNAARPKQAWDEKWRCWVR